MQHSTHKLSSIILPVPVKDVREKVREQRVRSQKTMSQIAGPDATSLAAWQLPFGAREC